MTEPEKAAKPDHKKNSNRSYTAFDRALISAAQGKLAVTIEYLGVSEGYLNVTILSVDKYFIEVEDHSTVPPQKKWINKALIASAHIEK